ncbi:MAG: hypothetical protein GX208_05020 [Firmicutes bacterium]|nr:hypothetical protein [Bacillota bacterium]
MSSVSKHDYTALINEINELKKENAYLKKELMKQKSYITELEDVSLSLAERQLLLGKSDKEAIN